MPGDLWSGADIIDIYTRRQATEDGVLVQLSGPRIYAADRLTIAAQLFSRERLRP